MPKRLAGKVSGIMAYQKNSVASVLRTFAFYLVSSVAAVPFILFSPALYLPKRLFWPGVTAYLSMQLFLLKHICGITYRVTGRENLPEAPFIFASQHQSSWENIFFQHILANPALFAKKEIFNYPIAGLVARRNGYIRVDRKGSVNSLRRALNVGLDTLRKGRNVLIFPSGTRTEEAHGRINHGVVVLYSKAALPVVPVLLNSGDFWPHVSWILQPGRIDIQLLPAIPPGIDSRSFLTQLSGTLRLPIETAAEPTQPDK